jgi:hypothetical protein
MEKLISNGLLAIAILIFFVTPTQAQSGRNFHGGGTYGTIYYRPAPARTYHYVDQNPQASAGKALFIVGLVLGGSAGGVALDYAVCHRPISIPLRNTLIGLGSAGGALVITGSIVWGTAGDGSYHASFRRR